MRRVVFLDRDGVINEFPGKGAYVTLLENFHILPQAPQAIRRLTEAGFEIYVVSNQGGISRGLIQPETLQAITKKMLEVVALHGGKINRVYYCTHQTSDQCDCKKPKTALFHRALGSKPVDLKNVYFIGDSEEDMAAGKAIGCRTVLVLSGRIQPEDVAQLPVAPEVVKHDLKEAVEWILEKKS